MNFKGWLEDINHIEIICSLESRATENSSLSNSSSVLDNIHEDTLSVLREDPSVKCGEGDLTLGLFGKTRPTWHLPDPLNFLIKYSPEDSPPVRNVRCKQIHQCPRYPVTAQGLPKNYGSLAVNISSSKCDKVVVCQHMWSKGLMRWWAWRGWCALGSNGRAMTEMTSGAASRGGQARGNFPVLGLPLPRLMLAHHPGPPNHLPNLWLLWMLSSEWGFLFPLLLKKLSVK